MKESSGEHGGPVIIEADQINDLIHALSHDNRQVIGPVVRDEAVVYEAVASAADLPKSIHDRQDAGACRLERTDDPRYFAVMPGPQGWKRYLYPPKQTLWQARRQDKGFELTGGDAAAAPAYAFLGVRACELAKEAGADFVKTSTGFGTGGATVEDVRLMRKVVGPEMGVKAAGGIRTYEQALAMIEAGANRIGASSGVKIVEGARRWGERT